MKIWGWVVQYGVTMVLALGLGVLLSQVPLFQETTLGSTRLRASQGIQFFIFEEAPVDPLAFGHRLTEALPSLWTKMKV